jgi:hypothetical protein
MKKSILILICLFNIFVGQAQQNDLDIKTLQADINANGQIDVIKPNTNELKLNIDNKSYTISYELLGFEFLSELSFTNNILTISGYNSGTGTYCAQFPIILKRKLYYMLIFDTFTDN